MSAHDLKLTLAEAYQPPMANGEVVFEEPWQGRVFGMAVALHEAGAFTWAEFQTSLIEVVGEWDATHDLTEPYDYYRNFASALDELLTAKGLLGEVEVARRSEELAARPHGHDH